MNFDAFDPEQVLRQRARALARAPERETRQHGIELLEFRLAQECYALEARYVSEVYPLRDLTALPGTPPFLRGVINVRGRIVAVIDLKRFFDLPEAGLTDLHRVVLVQNDELEVGVLADVVVGVQRVPHEQIQAPPPTPNIRPEYLLGVTAERLIVLDIARVLADPKLIVQDDAES